VIQDTSARGTYRVVNIHDDVAWFHFEGWISGGLWTPTEKYLESIILQHGAVLMVGNGWKWNGYDPQYRRGCTAWFLKRRASIRGVHLLVNSPVLRMGVQVVNLVVPIIRAYDEPASFMADASELVPRLSAHLHRNSLESPTSSP
jgi:hypothetical protein